MNNCIFEPIIDGINEVSYYGKDVNVFKTFFKDFCIRFH